MFECMYRYMYICICSMCVQESVEVRIVYQIPGITVTARHEMGTKLRYSARTGSVLSL